MIASTVSPTAAKRTTRVDGLRHTEYIATNATQHTMAPITDVLMQVGHAPSFLETSARSPLGQESHPILPSSEYNLLEPSGSTGPAAV